MRNNLIKMATFAARAASEVYGGGRADIARMAAAAIASGADPDKMAAQFAAMDLGMNVEPSPWVDINQIIANGDLSTGAMQTLAGAISAIPFEPSYLGDRKVFDYSTKKTNLLALEFNGQTINLVQTTPAGAPMMETVLNPRNVKTVGSVRIARRVTVMASEVADIREIAGAGLDTVSSRQNWKLKNALRDIRSTLEWHRVGAASGVVLDADGSTVIQSYFTLLGVAQPTIDCTQGTAATAKYVLIAKQILDTLEDALGNLAGEKPIVFMGRTFAKRFYSSADVITAYQYFEANRQPAIPGRDDLRYDDFEHGGVIWRQYRGSTAAGRFIPDTQAQVVVQGVPGTYLGHFCPPQDIVDRVNQDGQELDVTMEVLPHKKGVVIELQTNVVHWMNRPAAAIELTTSN